MRKILFLIGLLMTAGFTYAALVDDVTDQGVFGWQQKNMTAANLASMLRDYEDVTATNAILYTECGTTYFLNSATEFASTLPTPSAGCWFKFVVKAAPAAASYTVVTSGSSNILIGGTNELEVDTNDDGPYDADGDTITFADGVAVVGDCVEMISDGTSWYITGNANADGGITVTKAS